MTAAIRVAVVYAAATDAVMPGVTSADTGRIEGMLLREAVARLVVAHEQRQGCDRDLFRQWIHTYRDGCNTRAEVLPAEAMEAPEITGRCTLTGGRWYSFYDDTEVDNPRSLDSDHVVPQDSGAFDRNPQLRRDYVQRPGQTVTLAMTARSNRGKTDKKPPDLAAALRACGVSGRC